MLTSASLGTDKTDFFFSAALKKKCSERKQNCLGELSMERLINM